MGVDCPNPTSSTFGMDKPRGGKSFRWNVASLVQVIIDSIDLKDEITSDCYFQSSNVLTKKHKRLLTTKSTKGNLSPLLIHQFTNLRCLCFLIQLHQHSIRTGGMNEGDLVSSHAFCGLSP